MDASLSGRLASALAAGVDGEVRFDAGSRAAYAHDASNYRQPPVGVVVPRSVEAAVAAVGVCRAHDVPVLSRGGGTSLAGQCCNAAVVLDWSKHCGRLVSVDPERRRAVVEPGAVLDEVNAALTEHGLMVGPRPSTHNACTIGGMIQPHCHQHTIWGFAADEELSRRAGVEVDVLDVGCCGLAGNFGFERGHYDVSVGCAELGLWPAVRAADPGTAILADGFSCRTQIAAGTRARPVHLAELLAELV